MEKSVNNNQINEEAKKLSFVVAFLSLSAIVLFGVVPLA